MKLRAAVLIGVQKAKDLPELKAVWAGVSKMHKWALAQDIDVTCITDENEFVTLKRIKDVVRDFVNKGNIEQLIIYFSGHGINNAHNEYWLLSESMRDPDEAVNVTASEDFARFSGIPHVVFFSDACRTAAKGIGNQSIRGGVIFPTPTAYGVSRKVDLFYATLLGHPSLEVQTSKEAAKVYKAIYTEALFEALNGYYREVADYDTALGALVVRPWPLHDYLAQQVPIRVFEATGQTQQPDAEIKSRPDVWLSRVSGRRPAGNKLPSPGGIATSRSPNPPLLTQLSREALNYATSDSPTEQIGFLESLADSSDPAQKAFRAVHSATSFDFGPRHFETGCGFKISGPKLEAAFTQSGPAEIHDRQSLRLELPDKRPVNVLLVFENGTAAVLPGIFEFMTALTFIEDELVNVSYDPMDTSNRWKEFKTRQTDIRRLRSAVTASAYMGTFKLHNEDEEDRMMQKMHLAESFDPSLALYTAYAYNELGRYDRLREIAALQYDDLGITFFDIAMLSRVTSLESPLQPNIGSTSALRNKVLPFGPMLSHGWALLPAHGMNLPSSLEEIRRGVLTESLWTLYSQNCIPALKNAITSGEL